MPRDHAHPVRTPIWIPGRFTPMEVHLGMLSNSIDSATRCVHWRRILGPALNWLVGISGLSRFLLWLIFDSKIQLPDKLSRWWLLGLAIDRKLHRIREQIETKGTGNANGASVSRAVASQEDGSYSHGQRDSAIVGN